MRKHLGKARFPLIILIATAVVVLFFQVRSMRFARAAVLIPDEAQLTHGLLRTGLDPEALAASGLSTGDATTLVDDVFIHPEHESTHT